MELGVLAELVRAGRVPIKRAIVWAPQIANEISSNAYFEAAGLDDMHDLAEAGTYGTVADAERDFVEFLERYGDGGARR